MDLEFESGFWFFPWVPTAWIQVSIRGTVSVLKPMSNASLLGILATVPGVYFIRRGKGRGKNPGVKWSSSPGIRVGGDTHCKSHHGLIFPVQSSKHTQKYAEPCCLCGLPRSILPAAAHTYILHMSATIFQRDVHVKIIKNKHPFERMVEFMSFCHHEYSQLMDPRRAGTVLCRVWWHLCFLASDQGPHFRTGYMSKN